MDTLRLPCLLFQTQRKWDDVFAADMRCGDLTAYQLTRQFLLTQVSARVDPYTLTRLTPFDAPQHRFTGHHLRGKSETLTAAQCAELLFDEMRSLSWPFALYGPYRQLINRMINHMQYGFGMPFRDAALNMALKRHIEEDHSPQASLKAIKDIIRLNLRINRKLPSSAQPMFYDAIKETLCQDLHVASIS